MSNNRQVSVKTFGHTLARMANDHRRVAVADGSKPGFFVDVRFSERGQRYFEIGLGPAGVSRCEPTSQDAGVLRGTADALVAHLCEAAGVLPSALEQGAPDKVGAGGRSAAKVSFGQLVLTPVSAAAKKAAK